MADFATAPDLTLATPEMSPHTTWNPINQSCGSDHLPILITLGVRYNATGMSNESRWKLNKADWGLFKTLCEKNINMLSPQKDISTLSTNFTNQLIKICDKTIPKSKTGPKKKLQCARPGGIRPVQMPLELEKKLGKNTWDTRPKKIRISIINLRLMLEKHSKFPKKNVGNRLSQNSHINQQVRKYGTWYTNLGEKTSCPNHMSLSQRPDYHGRFPKSRNAGSTL